MQISRRMSLMILWGFKTSSLPWNAHFGWLLSKHKQIHPILWNRGWDGFPFHYKNKLVFQQGKCKMFHVKIKAMNPNAEVKYPLNSWTRGCCQWINWYNLHLNILHPGSNWLLIWVPAQYQGESWTRSFWITTGLPSISTPTVLATVLVSSIMPCQNVIQKYLKSWETRGQWNAY